MNTIQADNDKMVEVGCPLVRDASGCYFNGLRIEKRLYEFMFVEAFFMSEMLEVVRFKQGRDC